MTGVKSRGSEIETKLVTRVEVKDQVRETMDNAHEDKSGLLVPAKSIILTSSTKHGKRLKQAFDMLYPEYRGWLASLVTLQDPSSGELMHVYKECSFPRILILV